LNDQQGTRENGVVETRSGLSELWQFREVIKNFVSQDLKVKYRRSYLGFFWSLLNPLLMMIVISAVFSLLFKFNVRNYALYVLSGLVPWSFFSASIDGCTMSIISAEGMIKRQYFPKLVFPLSIVMQNLVTFFLSLTVLVCVLAPVTGFKVTTALFILPLSFLYITCVALGIGAITAVLTVYFRDTQHLISVFISVWFYLTPIIWPLDVKEPAKQPVETFAVCANCGEEVDSESNKRADDDGGLIPYKYRAYFKLNPMYAIIEMFHRPIYDGRFPTASEFRVASCVAVFCLGLGLFVFRRYEDRLIFNL
jgi:ABC-type polysaccharide/polyol phosphate export permease